MLPVELRKWNASWIWAPEGKFPNAHVLFRKDFWVKGAVKSARVFVAVETWARVYLNGKEVMRSASLSYPGVQHYQDVDVTELLRAGDNQVAVVAWYAQVGCTATWGGKDPGLLCEIAMETGEGAVSVGTDPSWKARVLDAWSGPRRSFQFNLDLIETLDMRKLPRGFPFAAIDGTFVEPESLPWPGVRMGPVEPVPFQLPVMLGEAPLQLVTAGVVKDRSGEHAIAAVAMWEEDIGLPLDVGRAPFELSPPGQGKAVTLVYFLGGYVKGYPHIEIEAPAGTVVDVAWCEEIRKGRFDLRPMTTYTADRYILQEGKNTISPEEWKAGRYLQLTVRKFPQPVRVAAVRFDREEYALRPRMAFECQDKRLQRIVEIGMRSAALCMHDRMMDCPWRERRQWIADIQRIGLVSYYAFEEPGFPAGSPLAGKALKRQAPLIRGVLRQHARLQDPTGRMWVCMPLMEDFPVQSMEWVRALIEYEDFTGDPTLREDLADNIEWLHRWFMKCRDDGGLFFVPHRPVQNWEDNPLSFHLKIQFETPFLASNLRYLTFLDDVTLVLKRAGHHEAAGRAQEEREALARRIVPAFEDRETGLLRVCAREKFPKAFSEFGSALAVRAGLPEFDAAGHFDRYMAFAQSHPDPKVAVPCSPFGKYETHAALGALKRPEAIVADILAHWGPMVDAGSDTAWEAFSGSSLCHGWAGIPIVALARHVPGYERWRA